MKHINRAAHQACYVWAQMLVAIPELPSAREWGWEQNNNGGWDVKWTELPEASLACYELVRCSCKKDCRSQCKVILMATCQSL